MIAMGNSRRIEQMVWSEAILDRISRMNRMSFVLYIPACVGQAVILSVFN
jgi:hypothetical protein